MITVVTLLWHDPHRARDYTFNHDHVRTLQAMVRRHLSLPHEFICITDDDIEGVRCVPLDWTKHVPGTCFIRLMLRRPDIGAYLGGATRIACLDLDCVITGSLDPIVNRKEDAVFWRNPNWPQPRRAFYQTSIQLFDAGARPELWTDFDPLSTPKWVNRRFGGAEQAWVSERLPWDEAHWDAGDGIYGAGRLFNGVMGEGVTTALPDNARIVFFPGNREPSQPEVQKLHPWVAAHYHAGPGYSEAHFD